MVQRGSQRALLPLQAQRSLALEQARSTWLQADEAVNRQQARLQQLHQAAAQLASAAPDLPLGELSARTLLQADAFRRRHKAQLQAAHNAIRQAEQMLETATTRATQARTEVQAALAALRPVEDQLQRTREAARKASGRRWDEEQDELLVTHHTRGLGHGGEK